MRKSSAKLALARETLRRLDARDLDRVAGGSYLSQFTDCEQCDPPPDDPPQPTSNPCAA